MRKSKIEEVPPTPRVVTKEMVTLSPKEIENFLHNAQLALCDAVEDEAITKNLFGLKQALTILLRTSAFTPAEKALVLVSAAWDIFTGKKEK